MFNNHKNSNFFLKTIDSKRNFTISNNNFDSIKKIATFHSTINNSLQIEPNQLVIHIEHGIGQYKGLKIINVAGILTEYFVILYANKAKLYVPVYYLHLIYNYSNCIQNKNIILNKLNNNTWIQQCEKTFKKIYSIAIKLLQLYSTRKSSKGFAFKKKIHFINYSLKILNFKLL
ncbi:CarD family transcriptional regulator [Buchnera aphidicola]|uniref:CarD family transcriptional regulator n=1 Tax=Buchnera aphidicola TaxID=9 RepID=UPI00135B1146|nr:CarD family transcriptional regulator [Buchnera aphidicola]